MNDPAGSEHTKNLRGWHARRSSRWLGALALVLAANAAAGQGSAFNFDNGLEGWSADGFGQVTWSELDAGFRTDSGSLLVDGDNARICVPLSATFLHHVLEARVLIPPNQGGGPAINVAFHPQPNCTGASAYYQANIDPADAVAGWIPLRVDTRDFPDPLADIIPPGAKSAELLVFTSGPVYFDDIRFFGYLALQNGTYPCFPSPFTACLNSNGRFQADLFWETDDNRSGPGWFVPQGRDSATVWFFNKGNTELLVKVLNGCGINGNFWVFVAGLTNAAVNLEVLDTFTNDLREYSTEGGEPFGPVLDTRAFPCQ